LFEKREELGYSEQDAQYIGLNVRYSEKNSQYIGHPARYSE